MPMIPVGSSNVAAVGYDCGILTVRFHNGYVYEYSGVSEAVFREFLAAPSKGRFVHHRLKNKYPTRRIQ